MSATLVERLFADSADEVVVHLFDGPYVTVSGRRKDVPEGSKRLLVFVALNRRRVERRLAAGALWPDGDESRAAGNLRSALWRLRGAGLDILETDKAALELRAGTVVDVSVVCRWASRLIEGSASVDELMITDSVRELLDLLPGWYDDWVIFERERIRQRLLHALEALSRRFVDEGCYAQAIEAAISALGADPLRESAMRTLLEAHLAEGNLHEVRRSYEMFARTLADELGVDPGLQLQALLRRADAGRIPSLPSARQPRPIAISP